MLRNYGWMALAILMVGIGCTKWPDDSNITIHDGSGGGRPNLMLPFPSGKYWAMTQGYKTGSHQDWGFSYGDDRYALDFSLSGCEAYGEPVTPMAAGTVKAVTEEGYGDHGYGNSVLIDHGYGYVSRYAHFSENLVDVGDEVDTYNFIGKVGNSGYTKGSACSEYPGTHLHVALYWYGDAIEPEPLSGRTDLATGCWYNRQGEEYCDGDPNDYENNVVSNFGVSYLGISPEEGNASETEFVWSTVVVSPDVKPNVDLVIYNPNDGVNYNFAMSTESEESPWVFTYRKTLRDAMSTYSYWVTVSDGEYVENSELQEVYVDESSYYKPDFHTYTWSPESGEAGSTEFEWYVSFESDYYYPEATLHVVNAKDADIYDFPMELTSNSDWWRARYEKPLRDPSTYAFWVTVENGVSASSTEVGHIEVSE